MPKAAKIRIGDERKVIHPNSRKASQIARAANHVTKLEKKRHVGNMKLGLQGEKLLWFKNCMDDDKVVYSKSDVLGFVENYLNRFEDEVEQINISNSIKGRKGQQHIPRLDSIKFILEKDNREFADSGFEIPNLFDEENVKYMKNWNGELRYLPIIKLTQVTRSQLR